MAWEQRERGGLYYVQKRRRGGKVRSVYVGTGLAGQYAALMDSRERDRAEEARRRAKQERRPEEQRRARLSELCGAVRGLVATALEALGYHRHHRQWRRRRAADMALTQAQLRELYMKAEQGNQQAAGEIFAAWRESGEYEKKLDKFAAVLFDFTKARAGKNLVMEAALDQRAKQMREALTEPGDSAIESLLIEQIITCSFALGDETKAKYDKMLEGMDMEEAVYRDKAIDRAQRRYLTTVRELGVARRLRLPSRQWDDEETRLRILRGGKASPAEIPAPQQAA
ncbi:MAG: hypothetical protein JWN14_610 [Chthonomonadales bacterium]|nr:hypothetical protein [Chthonomonadales bacterium]